MDIDAPHVKQLHLTGNVKLSLKSSGQLTYLRFEHYELELTTTILSLALPKLRVLRLAFYKHDEWDPELIPTLWRCFVSQFSIYKNE